MERATVWAAWNVLVFYKQYFIFLSIRLAEVHTNTHRDAHIQADTLSPSVPSVVRKRLKETKEGKRKKTQNTKRKKREKNKREKSEDISNGKWRKRRRRTHYY